MKARMRGLVGLALWSLTGCYVYNPYWYPGGYGTPYGTPPGGQTPPGAVVPQGAYLTPHDFSLGNAQPLPSANSGTASGQWKQSDQGSGNQVEAFRPDVSSSGGADVPVPQPRDPGESGSSAQPGGQQDDPFSSPLGMTDEGLIELEGIDDQTAAAQSRGEFTSPQPVVLRVPTDGDDEPAASEADSFVAPIRPVSSSQAVDKQSQPETAGQPHPFAYDRENYRWLRGIVDYDEADQTWHLMYAAKPDPDDPYGGDIALADHPDLSKLRDGDVVLVEGRVAPESRDQFGKPRYHIDKLVGPLVPKGADVANQD